MLKTKMGTSGFVVSTSTKVLTGGASAASGASQRPNRPGPTVLGSGEAKANDQLTLFDRYSGHAGVAEPMTDEEYQNELHRATERVPLRTTTPREGLSTWVLLSGSESTEMKSESTSTTRKVMTTTTTTTATPKPTTATKRFQPTTRRLIPSTTSRPARTPTTTTNNPEEKKEKQNKPLPKQKIASTTLKPVILKKVKKPLTNTPTTTTTTTTTTTPKPTTTTSTPTTTPEMVITEQSASTVANDLSAAVTDDSSIESSTFLILEPKDAQFDLPEDRSPSKTAPASGKITKKPTRKPNAKAPGAGTKKKPANKKTRKPEVKDVVAKPGNKNKPVSTQIINYLSREVMPTVGVGLVGLVMAAGLASYFLGSPLGALRRSDDRKDDLYYSNYEEYAGSDGQNEEDVFGKLIAGMPDRTYYRNNAVRRRTQVQPVRTGHQYYHVQPYSANKYPHITYRNRAYGGTGGPSAPETMYTNVNRQTQGQAPGQNQAKSQNEFYYNTPPTPYYPMRTVSVEVPTRPPSPVYSSSSVATTVSSTVAPVTTAPPSSPAADPIVETEHEMMPHPEAYSSEHSPEHHAHYVVGSSYSDSMLDMINSASVPEHGPRRRRRAVESDEDVEFENEIDVDEDRPKDTSVQSNPSGVVTEMNSSEVETTTDTGVMETTTESAHRYTWGDFIRNTVERKVAMGIHFLQHVTMDFQRYLNGVHDRFQHQQQQHPDQNHTSPSEGTRQGRH
uniref:Uncharacterized protein n=1 Tax=Anopheles culicifacies TaxID=139723 RepID=A0A182MK36_9DIPT